MRSPEIREKHLAAIKCDEFRKKVSEKTKQALSSTIARAKISVGVKKAMAEKPFELRSGKNHHMSKAVVMIGMDQCKIAVFPCAYAVQRIFGYPAKRVNECCLGKRRSYKGYFFAFNKNFPS